MISAAAEWMRMRVSERKAVGETRGDRLTRESLHSLFIKGRRPATRPRTGNEV